jgi:hypothetical protein
MVTDGILCCVGSHGMRSHWLIVVTVSYAVWDHMAWDHMAYCSDGILCCVGSHGLRSHWLIVVTVSYAVWDNMAESVLSLILSTLEGV